MHQGQDVTDRARTFKEILFEMQSERVPCIFCGTVTKTQQHVEYRTGIAVFTKYVCPVCTLEFMEKDRPR